MTIAPTFRVSTITYSGNVKYYKSAESMKFVIGFLIGIILTIICSIIYDFKFASPRDLAIVINIENDTNEAIDFITFEKDSGQIFSCTLRDNRCSLAVLYSGDTDFKVSANMKSGEIRKGSIGYADPRSTRNIVVSELKAAKDIRGTH